MTAIDQAQGVYLAGEDLPRITLFISSTSSPVINVRKTKTRLQQLSQQQLRGRA